MSSTATILYPVDFSSFCIAMAAYMKRAAALLGARVTSSCCRSNRLQRHAALRETDLRGFRGVYRHWPGEAQFVPDGRVSCGGVPQNPGYGGRGERDCSSCEGG